MNALNRSPHPSYSDSQRSRLIRRARPYSRVEPPRIGVCRGHENSIKREGQASPHFARVHRPLFARSVRMLLRMSDERDDVRHRALADGRYDAFILSAETRDGVSRSRARSPPGRHRGDVVDIVSTHIRDARSVRSRRLAVHARRRRRPKSASRRERVARRVRPRSDRPGSHALPGSPERIRTAASALRGRRPGPLDDGARTWTRHGTGHRRVGSGGRN